MQAQANRLALDAYRSLQGVSSTGLQEVLEQTIGHSISSTLSTSLSDCGWSMNITKHVRSGREFDYDWFAHGDRQRSINISNSSGSDAIGNAVNEEGNAHIPPKTCALVNEGFNEAAEMLSLSSLFMFHDGMDKIKGDFTARVSKQTHNAHRPMLQLYKYRMSLEASQQFLLTSQSAECENLLMTGHSGGGTLSTVARIDLGDVNSEGLYTDTCFGKPCFLFAISSPNDIWYGRVPEFESPSNASLLLVPDQDPAHSFLKMQVEMLSFQDKSYLASEGIYFQSPKNMLIRWRYRDAVFFETPNSKFQILSRQTTEIEIINQTFDEFRSTPPFIDRLHLINQWGPLVSFRTCQRPSAGKIITMVNGWCDHGFPAILWADTIKVDDESSAEASFISSVTSFKIPDMPGSAFNALMRQLAVLGLAEE